MSTADPDVKDEAFWWLGSLAIIKASAEDTGGQMSVVEVTEPPNGETRLYVQHEEDQLVYMLEGSATFEVDGEKSEAGPGDVAWAPRGVPRRFDVGPDGCKMLWVCTPGGFEKLVREMSEPATERKLPEPSEPDYDMVARVAKDNGWELLD